MPMTCEAATIETLAGRSGASPRMTASSPTRITWSSGMAPGVVDGARDDLGGSVVAAHRIDGDAHTGGTVGAPQSVRGGHRVSVRRRRRRPA